MTHLDAHVVVRRAAFTLDVTLRMDRGEVLAVLGPNGAGKSTLLSALAGLLHPDAGHIRLGDTFLSRSAHEPPTERQESHFQGGRRPESGFPGFGRGAGRAVPPHRRGIGLLAQQALLFPHMSALANVAFGPRASGVPRQEAERRARELLAAVDAAGLADRRPARMSGGQQQRVALARALAPGPDLLLLDEPLAALDVDAAPAMRTLLRRMIREIGQTALLVTHSALDALVLADRVLVLTEGRVVEEGPTREVLARPRSPFTARIAGLDLIPGMATAEGLRTADGTLISGRDGARTREEPAVAVFPPSAVAVFAQRPEGSPRNVIAVRVAALEPHGDLLRLRAAAPQGGPDWVEGLAADVTPAAVADLAVEPGAEMWFAVKATEVSIHPVGSPP